MCLARNQCTEEPGSRERRCVQQHLNLSAVQSTEGGKVLREERMPDNKGSAAKPCAMKTTQEWHRPPALSLVTDVHVSRVETLSSMAFTSEITGRVPSFHVAAGLCPAAMSCVCH